MFIRKRVLVIQGNNNLLMYNSFWQSLSNKIVDIGYDTYERK